MGFFDALDDTFGKGTALGAIEGFEERQYELGLIQEEKNKKLEEQLKAAAVGLGTTVKKRKEFNEQVTTFSAALSNDPSLKNKLKDLGPEGIRALARSALNTRYAEGGASGSSFRTKDLVEQVRKTPLDALEQFKVDPNIQVDTQKEDKKKDSTLSGGLLGNFANILSPTRAGEQQRSVMREEFAKAFPDATKEELDNAINSYGRNSGSTNEFETDTPFSVGVPLGTGGVTQFAQRAVSTLESLVISTQDNKLKVPEEAQESRSKTQEISNLLLQQNYYSVGEERKQSTDLTELFTTFKDEPDLIPFNNIVDIKRLLNSGNFSVTEYLKSLRDKRKNSPPPTTGSTPPTTGSTPRPPGPVTTGTPLIKP